jgi:hypothetical protein
MPFGCLDASASSLKVEKRLGDGFIELKEEIDPRGNGQTLLSIGLMRLAAASWSWLAATGGCFLYLRRSEPSSSSTRLP